MDGTQYDPSGGQEGSPSVNFWAPPVFPKSVLSPITVSARDALYAVDDVVRDAAQTVVEHPLETAAAVVVGAIFAVGNVFAGGLFA